MRILVVPDLHEPFSHPAAHDFLARVFREVRPDEVVCVGDEIDAHGWSRHERHPDAPGQGEELRQAVAKLRSLRKILGKHRRLRVCTSNHQNRHFRKAVRAGLPSAFLRDYREVIEAPSNWEWADRWVLDGIAFIHGEGYSGQNSALSAAQKQRCNTVIGHVHSWAAVQYHSNGINTIWGMNVGCLVDPASLAMNYAAKGANAQVLGCGVIDGGVPRFVPMSEGR